MANKIINVAAGRFVEFYYRIENNDPANSAFVLIPVETADLETDAVLIDKATVADFFAGATNEQTTMGRKILTDAELAAFPGPDNVANKYSLTFPTVTWAAAAGNPISKILCAYDSDTTAGTDANMIPVAMMDAAFTPSGIDFTLTSGPFLEATPV